MHALPRLFVAAAASGPRGAGPSGLSVLCSGAAAAAAAATLSQRRFLNLHEYQSMELMRRYGVQTPEFEVVRTPEEALAAARKLQQQRPAQASSAARKLIVKAQVLAGGRGLGRFKENGFQGGVHSCETAEEAASIANKMLGQTLVTKQTGAQGKPCSVVLVCEQLDVKREMYLALLLDRGSGGPVLIGSAQGGTSIEDIAEKFPASVIKMPIDIEKGINEEALERFVDGMKLSSPEQRTELATLVSRLYSLFQAKDCLLLEINPLVETREGGPGSSSGSGTLRVCDAKLNFDDNAAFRQQEVFSLRDRTQEDAGELEAEQHHLNYIKLPGQIGCMVNGAGLAMASLDLIQLKGLSPANFLDVGGGADEGQIEAALGIIQRDPDAKAVFVNIFGGIMRCDVIARGLLNAVKQTGFDKPLVIRLEGTNKTEAEELLRGGIADPTAKNLRIHAVSELDAAAEAVVKLAREL